jgi:hypothetical protein
MHSVLNALSDTFTSARYIPDGNPLVVGGGGLVGAAVLLAFVSVVASVRWRRNKHERASTVRHRPPNTSKSVLPSDLFQPVDHTAPTMDLTPLGEGIWSTSTRPRKMADSRAALDG